jgi:hypothetical protein
MVAEPAVGMIIALSLCLKDRTKSEEKKEWRDSRGDLIVGETSSRDYT